MGNLETFNKREYVEPQCQCEKPMTNADRIRNMTDEELAEYIYGVSEGTVDCVICDDDCDYCELEECKDRMLQWLQAEVKEGVDGE